MGTISAVPRVASAGRMAAVRKSSVRGTPSSSAATCERARTTQAKASGRHVALTTTSGAGRLDLLSFAIPELFIGSQNNQTNNGFSGSDIGRKSYVGRLNYTFKDKYLFEATFRADGNVLFSPQTRWGYFPSFSAGWVISGA